MVIIGGIINGLSQSIHGRAKIIKPMTICAAPHSARTASLRGQRSLSGVCSRPRGWKYPRDYKLINVGGTPQALAALASGQIAAAPLSLPVNFVAEEQGFNTIGRFIDVIPHYQLSVYSVLRPWAEKIAPLSCGS